MINAERIVPVVKIDLISLYSTILIAAGISAEKVSGDEIQVKTNSKTYLADEPVKSIDFDATASSVSAGTVYFVPDFDFDKVTKDGTKVTATVDADGATLYKAVLDSGTVTVSKVGL